MKRIMIAVLLIGSVNVIAFAQDQEQTPSPQMSARQMKSPEQRAQMLTNKMEKELNLTSDQKKTVYDINLSAAQKMTDAMQNRDRGAMKNIKEERDAAMEKVLDAGQLQKYQQMEAAMMQKRMANRQNRMSNRGGE
ncbi:MAG: hypothetical protein JSS96_04920 [Bacteroidetes bacterium]|nr:hypothetical protein [Bacteroidota bacterium]